jgi:hypothetical protein
MLSATQGSAHVVFPGGIAALAVAVIVIVVIVAMRRDKRD